MCDSSFQRHNLYTLTCNKQVEAKSAVRKRDAIHKSRDGEVRIVLFIFMTPCGLKGG